MAEYIERDKAIKKMCEGCNIEFSDEPCDPYDCRLHRGLREIPAADVVEVVRCKDCKHARQTVYGNYHCLVDHRLAHEETDYCSFGERKEGAEE